MTSARQHPAIAVQIRRDFRDIGISLPRLKKLVAAVCRRFAGRAGPQRIYQISIAVVDDSEIAKLNNRFLGRNTTTDCLSFDLSDGKPSQAAGDCRILELIVNGEMAARQAASRRHSGEAELALYIAHALLHNFGFDDRTPGQARKMHQAEDKILQELGYGLVYNKSVLKN